MNTYTKNLSILFVVVIVLFNLSCLKKQNLDEEDLGPAIQPMELSKAIASGFGPLDFNEIKNNEFSSYVLTQKIQDSFVDTIEQQDLLVESADNTSANLALDLLVTKIKYSAGQSSQSVRKWHKDFPKQTGLNSQTVHNLAEAENPTLLFFLFQTLVFNSCINSGEYPETCHRLQTTDIKYKVPQSAAGQHGCSNNTACYINAKKIEFDMIQNYLTDKDGKPKRIHYTLILSTEVPFMSRFLQFCSRSLYEISSNQQKILADLCYNINNYAFGRTGTNSK